MSQYLSLALAAGLAQAAFLLLLLRRRRPTDRRALRPLRALLTLLAAVLAARLALGSAALDWPVAAGFVADAPIFFVGPAVYFTVAALLQRPVRTPATTWPHLLPAAVHLAVVTPLAAAQAAGATDLLGEEGLALCYALTEAAMIAHLGTYATAALLLARRYRATWRERYRTPLPTALLTPLLTAGLTLAGLWLLSFAARLLGVPAAADWGYATFWLLLVAYVFAAAYALLADPATLQLPELRSAPVTLPPSVAERVGAYVREQRPYLRAGLTLDGLATAVGLPRHELSHVLNHHFGQSFFDYVNGLRVGEYLRLRDLPANTGRTIAELSFEAGFNSRTAFNRAFRKHTGHTPSTYAPPPVGAMSH